MFKKVLRFLCLSIIVTALFAAGARANAAVTVSIYNQSAASGATVEVPINVDQANGIAGFQFTVTYDSSVLKATGVSAGGLDHGWLITPNTNTAGQIKIIGVSSSLTPLSSGSGSIVKIEFKVTGQNGDSTNLTFTNNKLTDKTAAVIPSQTQPGTFTVGTPAPAISVTPTSLNFGSVVVDQTSSNQTLTIKNTGNAALTISGITLGGTNADQFILGDTTGCNATITAGSTCSFPVSFDPTSVGTMSASVSITNDSANPTVTVALSGKSTAVKPPVINSFTSDTSSGVAPLQVTFTVDATDLDGVINAYKWDFGDGTSEKTAVGTDKHTYKKAGIYDAIVTLIDNDGKTLVNSKKLLIMATTPKGTSTRIKQGGGKPSVGILVNNGSIIKDAVVKSVDSGIVGMPTDGKGKPTKEISFTIEGNTSNVVKVTIGPLTITKDTIFYKKVKSTWFNLSENTSTSNYGLTVDKAKGMVSFNVTDNGKLDSNKTIGTISDPLIVAQKTTSNGTGSTSTSSGGGGGCTIGTSNDIDFSLPLFLLLSLFYLFKKDKRNRKRA